MNITEFRTKYPEYGAVGDLELARRLHAKHYSGVPFQEFADRFGVAVSDSPKPQGAADARSDLDLLTQLRRPYNPTDPSPMAHIGMDAENSRPRFTAPDPAVTRRQQEWNEQTDAFNQLLARGFDQQQINMAAGVYQGANAPRALPVLGATLGSFASALIPGPDEAVIAPALWARALQGGVRLGTSLAGTGAGAMAGTVAEQAARQEPVNLAEGLKNAKSELAWQGGATAAFGGLGLIFSPMVKRTFPEAAAVVQDFYNEVKGVLTPAQRDRRIGIQMTEAASRGSFGGQQIFEEFSTAQKKKAAEYADRMLDKVAAGVERLEPEEMGTLVNDFVSRPEGSKWQVISDLVDPMYAQLDELTKGKLKRVMRPVDVPVEGGILGMDKQPLTRQVMRAVGQEMEGGIVPTVSLRRFGVEQLQLDKRIKHLTPDGRAKMQDLISLPKQLSFQEMRLKHSALMRDVRKLTVDVDQASGMVKKASGLAGAAIESPEVKTALAKMAPEAMPLYENANAIYRTASDQWDTLFPQHLLRRLEANPTKAVNAIFSPKQPEKTRAMKEFFTKGPRGESVPAGEAAWNQLGTAWVQQSLEAATDSNGFISPSVFGKRLMKMGDPTLEVMFSSPENLRRVKNIETLLQRIQPPSNPGTASVVVKLAQTGGIGLVGAGIKSGEGISIATGGALALSPAVFARIATTKWGSDMLSAGLKSAPGSPQLIGVASRIMRELYEEDRRKLTAKMRAEAQLRWSRTQPSTKDLAGYRGRMEGR